MRNPNWFLALGAFVVICFAMPACSTESVTDRADPIEGMWTLKSVECPAGSDFTADGKRWASRLEARQESYVMRYTHGGRARVFGKSFPDQKGTPDQMNYCDIDADLEWTDRQLPSVCDYHAQTSRRGHATDDLCNDEYRYVALLCVWTNSAIEGNKLRFSLGDPSQAKSRLIDIKNFLPQLCEDGQPVLVFDRVL